MYLKEEVENYVMMMLQKTGMMETFLQSFGNRAEYETQVRAYYSQFRQMAKDGKRSALANSSASVSTYEPTP